MPLNQNSYYTSSNNKSQQLSERPYQQKGHQGGHKSIQQGIDSTSNKNKSQHLKTKNPRSFHFEGFGKETKFSYICLPKPFVSSIAQPNDGRVLFQPATIGSCLLSLECNAIVFIEEIIRLVGIKVKFFFKRQGVFSQHPVFYLVKLYFSFE